MQKYLVFSLFAGLVWFSSLVTVAHHSVSGTYETASTVQLTGIISRVEWRNPHVLVYLSVAGNGAAASERIEIAGPQSLDRRGVSQRLLRVGEKVQIEVWKARPGFSGLPFNGRTLTLMDGTLLDVGDLFGAAASRR